MFLGARVTRVRSSLVNMLQFQYSTVFQRAHAKIPLKPITSKQHERQQQQQPTTMMILSFAARRRKKRNVASVLFCCALCSYVLTAWHLRNRLGSLYADHGSSSSSSLGPLLDLLQLSKTVEPKFHVLDPDRKLALVKYGEPGLANQLSCFQAAAALAIRYNRTLRVPFEAYLRSVKHATSSPSLKFHQLLDPAGVALSYEVGQYVSKDTPEVEWDPLYSQPSMEDPFPTEETIQFRCIYAYSLLASPLQYPPYQRNYFPFHLKFQLEAERIYKAMLQDKSLSLQPTKTLGLHIRRGDRLTWPVLDCSTVPQYPYLAYTNGCKGVYCSLCASNDVVVEVDDTTHQLTWDAFLQHYQSPSCPTSGFPVCSSHYSAVFVASDDASFLSSLTSASSHFYSIMDLVTTESNSAGSLAMAQDEVSRLVVELLVLEKVDRLVPSFSSSITDLLIRLRMTFNRDSPNRHDAEINQTYWRSVLERPIPMEMP